MKVSTKTIKLSDLVGNNGQLKGLPKNPRIIKDNRFKALKKSIEDSPEFIKLRELIVYPIEGEKFIVIAGNQRLAACKDLKIKEVPCKVLPIETPIEKLKEYTIKDNVSFGEMDWEDIADWDINEITSWGEEAQVNNNVVLNKENNSELGIKGSMTKNFIVPPFSVLDTKQGYWLDRKKEWNNLGLKSGLGRDVNIIDGNITKDKYGVEIKEKASIFDPVLCELIYTWFNVPNGSIIDPFAGGSVRGVVASVLGFEYYGNDLRPEQIDANYKNAKIVLNENQNTPNWTCGDSLGICEMYKNKQFDLFFTCPPYADLEVYSNDPRYISNMNYSEFLDVYRKILHRSITMLKENRFAAIVVGEVRDKKGSYLNFINDTINILNESGLHYYNEMILVNAVGTLAIRSGRQFNNSRKIGKQHQNVLIFYKGDMNKIKEIYPKVNTMITNKE